MPVKRKSEEMKLDEDDDLLGSIMEEVHSKTSSFSTKSKPMVLYKKPKKSLVTPSITISPIRPFDYCSPNVRSNPFAVNQFKSAKSHLHHLRPKVVDFDHLDDSQEDVTSSLDDTVELFEAKHKKLKSKVTSGSTPHTEALIEEVDFNDMSNDCFANVEDDSHLDSNRDEVKNGCHPEKLSLESTFLSNIRRQDASMQSAVDIVIDPGELPLTVLKTGESVLQFFWIDAFEDPFKQPGVVYLFGKINLKDTDVYTSCCVIVKNIQRKMFVLPRETHMNMMTKSDTDKPVTMQDVYSEISKIAEKMNITEFKTKMSSKNYAFESTDIPDKCDYLEVQYSAQFPSLPSDLSGATFSHVLGTDTTSLELLLLEQKLKGPGWLNIQCPQLSTPPVSWCKVEAIVTRMQHVVPSTASLPIPPVTVLSLRLRTVVNPKTRQNEIVAISCVIHNKFYLDKAAPKPHFNSYFCALTKPSDCIFPYDFKQNISRDSNLKIECLDSERSLLGFFLAKMQKFDPDILIGHDIIGFELGIILHRMAAHKIPNWSRLGRLKRAGPPRFTNNSQGFSERNATAGRLISDVKISSKELIRCRSYELDELANQILDAKFEEIVPECVRDYYVSTPKLLNLVSNALTCCDLILRVNVELNTLPLALQITNIAGCVMSRTLLGGRSERNEYLLLHAFHEKNYIYPPKAQSKKNTKMTNPEEDSEVTSKKGRRKPAYEGGLVLDPKIGFYDKYILLMDFNSLYPSIIQEYNICFTTLDNSVDVSVKSEEELQSFLPDANTEPGILPTEIRKLVESRKQVKQMMKAADVPSDRMVQYDIRQRALKLTANSMYGCLGFSHSRFYAKSLAALVTRKGREILMKTKGLVEKMGLDVIYGDTDSIMINTNQTDFDGVNQLGSRVKSEVNKLYRLLEIDIDGLYKPMLLLKKKKYAALTVSRSPNGQLMTKPEMKGLDIVRRDWSQLAKEAGEFVIKEILSDKSKEDVLETIHSYLMALGENIRADRIPISTYVILKQLTKQPEDYSDQKNLPHVQVALRMNSKTAKKLRQNDTVPYVVCIDGTTAGSTQRAYHPDELKNSELKIDVEYYLSNQVHPVVSRLCSPIEGTDAAMIATLLGLNPSKYAVITKEEEQYDDKFLTASSYFDNEELFKSCEKIALRCPAESCSEEITLDGVFSNDTPPFKYQLSTCPKCKANMCDFVACLSNQIQIAMHKYINIYYKRILMCEDPGCAHTTRKMPLIFTVGGPVCPSCKTANLRLQYDEGQLYCQLAYFCHVFDVEKAKNAIDSNKDKILEGNGEDDLYKSLKSTVDKILQLNTYGEVNLPCLFQGLFLRNDN